MSIFHDIPQGTEEWHLLRMGRITASKFAPIMVTPREKGAEFSSGAITLLLDTASEILTNERREVFSTLAMEHGKNLEEAAREHYEVATFQKVRPGGFWIHGTGGRVGCSPDGLIGEKGLLEIKCPEKPSVHLATIEARAMPTAHQAQVQGQLWVTGREWCDFVSYDPRFPEGARLFVQRIYRDEHYITTLALRAGQFVTALENLVNKYQKKTDR